MNYQTIQIYNLMSYEFAQVEGDFSSLRESDIKSVTPAGMRCSDFLEQLRSGHQVLLTDTPSIPLLIRDRDEWGNRYWRVNPEVEPQLDGLAYKAYTARAELVNHGIGSSYAGSVNASVYTEPYVEHNQVKLTLAQRLAKQRQERLQESENIQLPPPSWQDTFNRPPVKPSRFAKSALVPRGTCNIGTQREQPSSLGEYAAYTLAIGQGVGTAATEDAFLTRIGGAALAELPNLTMKIVGRAGILAAFMPSQLGDGTLNNENDLMDKTTVETNIRLGFNADNRIYGYHVNGVNIPKREVTRVGDKFVVALEPDVTIEWIPMSGDFGGKPILVNPIPDLKTYNIWVYPEAEQGQEFDNTYITPIADADLQDYILTFPADTGLPPLYVVYSHQVRQPNGQFGASKYPKPELNRTSLRAKTKRQIEAEALRDENGNFTDKKGKALTDWHYGHREGLENRRILRAADQIGMTQEELNDFVNSHPDYFLIEDAKTNLSHVNEKPGSDELEDILEDMKDFLSDRRSQ
ncbi:S-type Pyocin [Vibrio ruber DSM 16370]|uniref:S-type Pyocin n=1 Tax=Vibrio ruber (strain DSM 16370 / JCM 11486 / BCRC 17186 / CECT 7878 / LMG 23124 / VR1) TaxID=1123498 RepID=A0A1R4LAZ4_VIBR1|nr:S-type pyocin domain-containing protein [Vibrio ruber]SJN53752.1 S-type Pyocin [Vibrio ruber DSM 16370]